MKLEEIKKGLPFSVYVFLENGHEDTNTPIRKIEPYNHYQTNGYARNRKEKFALAFGLLILFTVFTSFIALLFMTILP